MNKPKSYIFLIGGFAAFVIIMALVINISFGVFNPFYVVVSGSMIPNLNIGDVVIIKNNTPDFSFDHLKRGDIIVFKAPDDYMEDGKQRIIVHRIVAGGLNRDGQLFVVTKGDANDGTYTGLNYPISKDKDGQPFVVTMGDANDGSYPGLDFPIYKDNYIGRVAHVIPKIGLVSIYLAPPVNYILIAIILCLLAFFMIRERKSEVKTREK